MPFYIFRICEFRIRKINRKSIGVTGISLTSIAPAVGDFAKCVLTAITVVARAKANRKLSSKQTHVRSARCEKMYSRGSSPSSRILANPFFVEARPRRIAIETAIATAITTTMITSSGKRRMRRKGTRVSAYPSTRRKLLRNFQTNQKAGRRRDGATRRASTRAVPLCYFRGGANRRSSKL